MDLDLSEAEVQLIERLLRAYVEQTQSDAESVATAEDLLHRLTHPMRGGLDLSDQALVTDVGESIAPNQAPDSSPRS
jgi:hypothetical protein